MFERMRIGSVIYTLGDKLRAEGAPVDNVRARVLYDPLIGQAARDMKTRGLSADQAAIAFLLELGNIYVKKKAIKSLYDTDRLACTSLINLYLAAYVKMNQNISYFCRAQQVFDQDVFDEIQGLFDQ